MRGGRPRNEASRRRGRRDRTGDRARGASANVGRGSTWNRQWIAGHGSATLVVALRVARRRHASGARSRRPAGSRATPGPSLPRTGFPRPRSRLGSQRPSAIMGRCPTHRAIHARRAPSHESTIHPAMPRRAPREFLSPVLAAALVLALGAATAAPGATETLFDGTAPSRWDTGRDAGRLEREYSASELRIDGEPPSLLWRFASRGPAFNDIFLRRGVRLPAERFRVRVKNEGPAVTFSAKVRDASGPSGPGADRARGRRRLAVDRSSRRTIGSRRRGRATRTAGLTTRSSTSPRSRST